jgi:DNA-binding GntR family transcriptional regulator
MATAQREHRDIIAAVRDADADAATAALRRHRATALEGWTRARAVLGAE